MNGYIYVYGYDCISFCIYGNCHVYVYVNVSVDACVSCCVVAYVYDYVCVYVYGDG